MFYNQNISLDLNIDTPYQVVSAKQGDNISRTLTITVLKDGNPFDMPSNIKASYRIRKPDNHSSWNEAEVFPSEHKVVITFTAADLSVAGRCYADVLFTVGTAQISTASFILNVQQIPDITNNVLGSSEFEHLIELTNYVYEIIQLSTRYVKDEVVVDLFNKNNSYSVGNYTFQDGALFKCIRDTAAGTEWNENNWLKITVMSQITDLQEAILNSTNDLQNQITTNKNDLQNQITASANDLQNQIITNKNDLQDQIVASVNDLQDQITANNDDLQNQITTNTNNLNDLQNQVTTNISNLQNQITTSANDLQDQITTSTNDLQDQIDDLQDQITVNKNDLQDQITANTRSLQDQINDLNYTALSISSYTINPTVAEIGSIVNNVVIKYTFNKKPETIEINNTSITPVTSGTYELENQNLTNQNNKNYTIVAVDKGSPTNSPKTVTKAVKVQFHNRICWGVSGIPQVLDSAFVRNLHFTLSNVKTSTITLTAAGDDQYIWYALPVSLGQVNFKVGNFDGGFNPPDIVSVADASEEAANYIDYYVYRSTNSNLGKTTIVISNKEG